MRPISVVFSSLLVFLFRYLPRFGVRRGWNNDLLLPINDVKKTRRGAPKMNPRSISRVGAKLFLPSWDVVTPSSLKLFNWLNDNFCFHTWNGKCDPNFSRKWALDQLTLFKMWEWAGTNIRLTAYPSPINLGKENDVTNYWKMNFLHFIYLTRKTEMEKNVGLKGNMILASREEGWQNLDENS